MEFNTDSAMFLFLFILPGAFSKVLLYRFAPKKNEDQNGKTATMEICEIVAFSALVLLGNMTFLWWRNGSFSAIGIMERFQNERFLFKYICLTCIVSTVFTIIVYILNKTLVFKLVNTYNKALKHPLELQFPTIWENLFEGKELIDFANKPVVISIEKNGTVLSCGFLSIVPAPHTKCNELALKHSNQIRGYLARDAESDEENKIFGVVDFEYYNMEYDVVIKIYKMDKYNEYMNQ